MITRGSRSLHGPCATGMLLSALTGCGVPASSEVVAMNDDRLEVSWAGASRWFPLIGSLPDMTIEDLAVGQFDSDPRADLFFGDGSKWWWASAGGGGGGLGWSQFGISGYRVSDLRFG